MPRRYIRLTRSEAIEAASALQYVADSADAADYVGDHSEATAKKARQVIDKIMEQIEAD